MLVHWLIKAATTPIVGVRPGCSNCHPIYYVNCFVSVITIFLCDVAVLDVDVTYWHELFAAQFLFPGTHRYVRLKTSYTSESYPIEFVIQALQCLNLSFQSMQFEVSKICGPGTWNYWGVYDKLDIFLASCQKHIQHVKIMWFSQLTINTRTSAIVTLHVFMYSYVTDSL